MRKNIVDVSDAAEQLRAIGYRLTTRRHSNCFTGSLQALTSEGHRGEWLEALSHPSQDQLEAHPALFAWLADNAVFRNNQPVII